VSRGCGGLQGERKVYGGRMAKRKEQFRKQQIATVGHSNKHSRVLDALAKKIKRLRGWQNI